MVPVTTKILKRCDLVQYRHINSLGGPLFQTDFLIRSRQLKYNTSIMTGSKALQILFKAPVTEDMIKFLTTATLNVIPCGTSEGRYPRYKYPSPLQSPTKGKVRKACEKQWSGLPSLTTFIAKIVRYTNVYTATLLTTVVYLNKLKKVLPKDATGIPSTSHRIFLACLILSAKFHNDSSPLNKHWTEYTDGLFTIQDVNLMERQLLKLFDWNIRVSEHDLHENLSSLLLPIKQDLIRSKRLRNYTSKRKPSFSWTTKDHHNAPIAIPANTQPNIPPTLPPLPKCYDPSYYSIADNVPTAKKPSYIRSLSASSSASTLKYSASYNNCHLPCIKLPSPLEQPHNATWQHAYAGSSSSMQTLAPPNPPTTIYGT
ncbi:Pcl1p Ecym_3535 [Eremothecium cymbalariae DBVPG|uniref:Cyclin N-terminal domain-containing protein n=1 Tax=Eremothecium cymbalariae (strain CBS 270.75 / DBVPG 7215 / KCTC 17166 / NRRL Y-17582) TaxID=931890 RepID=G8JQM8_ERECY|nr:Hypothetical protein Ecym_3535 [Eremothecium cymbalariae DBVPG\